MPNNGSTKEWTLDRIMVNCTVDQTSGCWLWNKACNVYGYGAVRIAGRTFAVHRISAELATGKHVHTGRRGHVVRHTCDTPRCCNPAHLIIGSHKDNVKDKMEKGRQLRGSGIGNSKLTEDRVRAVRFAVGTNKEVADRFEISQAQVSRIKNRVDWAWLA